MSTLMKDPMYGVFSSNPGELSTDQKTVGMQSYYVHMHVYIYI